MAAFQSGAALTWLLFLSLSSVAALSHSPSSLPPPGLRQGAMMTIVYIGHEEPM